MIEQRKQNIDQIVQALEGAAQGIAAAVEQETITPMQIYCLPSLIAKQLKAEQHR